MNELSRLYIVEMYFSCIFVVLVEVEIVGLCSNVK